jgi:hypothetical protein
MSSDRTIGEWEGGRKGLKRLYSIPLMMKKIWRFAEPFLPICVVEIIIIILQDKHLNLPRIFLKGAYGPGSYYVPLMIQLVILFPIIYVLVKKYPRASLPIMAAITLLFETYVVVFNMEKADQYAFFSPNYFAAKKTQIKLEKLLNTDIKEYDHNIFTPNKKKEWRVQYNATQKCFLKDSQYNLKQIVKNFKLNREQFLHGYSNKYINLCTDLLYEN